MPLGAEGENFLNFGPFLIISNRFSITWPECGRGACPPCPHPKYATVSFITLCHRYYVELEQTLIAFSVAAM